MARTARPTRLGGHNRRPRPRSLGSGAGARPTRPNSPGGGSRPGTGSLGPVARVGGRCRIARMGHGAATTAGCGAQGDGRDAGGPLPTPRGERASPDGVSSSESSVFQSTDAADGGLSVAMSAQARERHELSCWASLRMAREPFSTGTRTRGGAGPGSPRSRHLKAGPSPWIRGQNRGRRAGRPGRRGKRSGQGPSWRSRA